jgi:hypothetical protein
VKGSESSRRIAENSENLAKALNPLKELVAHIITLHPRKLAFSIDELTAIHPEGRTKLREAIDEGRLTARKSGRSTIILLADYQAYLEAMPKLEPGRAA